MWYTVSPLQQLQVPGLYLLLFRAGKNYCLPSRIDVGGPLLQFWNRIKCQCWPLLSLHTRVRWSFLLFFLLWRQQEKWKWIIQLACLSLRLLLESKSYFSSRFCCLGSVAVRTMTMCHPHSLLSSGEGCLTDQWLCISCNKNKCNRSGVIPFLHQQMLCGSGNRAEHREQRSLWSGVASEFGNYLYGADVCVCPCGVISAPADIFFWRFTVGSEKGMLWVQQTLLLLLKESWYEGRSVKKSLGHWTVLLLVDRLHYLLYRNTVNTLRSQHWLKELVHWITRPTDASAMQCPQRRCEMDAVALAVPTSCHEGALILKVGGGIYFSLGNGHIQECHLLP